VVVVVGVVVVVVVGLVVVVVVVVVVKMTTTMNTLIFSSRSRSSYITYLAHEATQRGWRCVALNYPGTLGERLTVPPLSSGLLLAILQA